VSKAKAKGSAEERRIAKLIDAIPGWRAHRVPLSGAIAGLPGDVFLVSPDGKHFLIESKRRKNGEGFKTLRRWKGPHDILWLREDRQRGMVVIEETVFLMLLEHWRTRAVAGKEE
jgi:hypothetical protein